MKATLLILGCLLAVQFGHPMPLSEPSSQSERENTPRAIFSENIFLINEELFLYMLNGMAEVYGAVIEKAELEENPSEELKKHLAGFAQFISDVKQTIPASKNMFKMMGMAQLLKRMIQLCRSYELARIDYPEQMPEKLSLAENGLDTFRDNLRSKVPEYETKVYNALDAYVSSGLTPAEVQREHKLIDWYNNRKNNINTPLFTNYVDMFNQIH